VPSSTMVDDDDRQDLVYDGLLMIAEQVSAAQSQHVCASPYQGSSSGRALYHEHGNDHDKVLSVD